MIIRLDHLGDIICALKVLPFIKQKVKAKITFLTSCEGSSFIREGIIIDKVVSFSPPWFKWKHKRTTFFGLFQLIKAIRNEYPDAAIDLRGDLRHIIAMFLAGVSCRVSYSHTGGGFLLSLSSSKKDLDEHKKNQTLIEEFLRKYRHNLVLNNEEKFIDAVDALSYTDKEELSRKFNLNFNNPYMVLHPFAGTKSKLWPRGRWEELLKWLTSNYPDYFFILAGKGQGRFFLEGKQVVNLINRTTLRDLAGLEKYAQIVISSDSGPAHIAYFLRVPLVLLASGTNRIERWFKESKSTMIIQKQVPCLDCQLTECAEKKHYCMDLITPAEVEEKINAIIEAKPQ